MGGLNVEYANGNCYLSIGHFVAAFALLTSFRNVGSSYHILLQQTECKLTFESLIKVHGQDLSVPEISVQLVSCV